MFIFQRSIFLPKSLLISGWGGIRISINFPGKAAFFNRPEAQPEAVRSSAQKTSSSNRPSISRDQRRLALVERRLSESAFPNLKVPDPKGSIVSKPVVGV